MSPLPCRYGTKDLSAKRKSFLGMFIISFLQRSKTALAFSSLCPQRRLRAFAETDIVFTLQTADLIGYHCFKRFQESGELFGIELFMPVGAQQLQDTQGRFDGTEAVGFWLLFDLVGRDLCVVKADFRQGAEIAAQAQDLFGTGPCGIDDKDNALFASVADGGGV